MDASRRHDGILASGLEATRIGRRDVLALGALGLTLGMPGMARAAPAGQLTWGIHISLAPTWFEPAEASGVITPFMVFYALHDGMVKPMPGQVLAPSLAESFAASEDGRSYEFVLRDRALFHNGEPVTADDVKFSFDRYRGTAQDLLKQRVAAVETPDARHVRFLLKEPWPDFLTFYSTMTGAGWIVPRKYVEKVGDEGYKKAPVGAGPYKFVSFNPGVELVFEAFDQYWRKPPSVKRLIFKVIPDEATRLAALKGGEVDIVYSIRGELAEDLQRTPGLTLKPAVVQGVFCVYFPDQWDPKSPWHDERVRRAASLAIDRKGTNEALTLGYSRLTGNIMAALKREDNQRSSVFDLAAWYFSIPMQYGLLTLSLFLGILFFVQYNQTNRLASSGSYTHSNQKAATVELNSTLFYREFNRTKQSGISTTAFSIHQCLQACQKLSTNECFACKSKFTKLNRQYETI